MQIGGQTTQFVADALPPHHRPESPLYSCAAPLLHPSKTINAPTEGVEYIAFGAVGHQKEEEKLLMEYLSKPTLFYYSYVNSV